MSKSKTDTQLVADANDLARMIYSLQGYQVPTGYRFDQATHPQEVVCWHMAIVAYEHINGTDIENALSSIE